MKPLCQRFAVALLALLSFQVSATTRYVDVNGTNPASPYLGWSTAATNIQDAIDAAVDGDLVLVTNGIYSTGGRVVYGQETNRAALTKTVTLSSMNGPQATMVLGGTQTRGVYVSSNAVLNGFTIVSGRADIPSGDAIQERSGGGVWCEPGGVVSNCIIRNNFALLYGGGIYGGTVYNCTVTTNQSSYGYGGGAAASILYNSTLMSNTVPMGSGGGAYLCLLSNCTLTANYAYSSGGGVGRSTNYNCVLSGNSNFYHDSGGADHGILYNCVLTRNTGGANYCTLYNCTVVNNSAYIVGGAYYCTAYNSIIYFNSGPTAPNWSGSPWAFTNCCTFPLPPGAGNFTNAPGLVDVLGENLRLQIGSRCINAGNNALAPAGTDLDGNARIFGGTVDLGAYESQFIDTAGVHFVSLESTNPVPPYTNWLTAATNIQDAVSVAYDGEIVIAAEGAYTLGGTVLYGQETNRVALTNGISLLGMSGAIGTAIVGGTQTRCVYVGSNAVLSGFTITNGNTRFGDIIYESSGGGIWCEPGGVVSNCFISGNRALVGYGGGIFGGMVYHSTLTNNRATFGGGAASNVLINCTLTKNSASSLNLNSGGGAIYSSLSNCLVVANSCNGGGGGANFSTLTSCVVSNNTAGNGGGVCMGIANNSLISSNSAFSGGGGAYSNILNNCVLRNNFTSGNGAGASGSVLVNCTVVSNSTPSNSGGGGGINGGSASNSIIYYNFSGKGPNFLNSQQMYYCCTAPLPLGGFGNITNEPVFVNLAGGDFHLQTNSPCINSGNNTYVTSSTDLDGNPRIKGSTVDIGAYEYQSPVSLISYAWLQQYQLPINTNTDLSDADHDGMNNWQEWRTGTIPTNSLSLLQIMSPAFTNNPSGVTVSWQSVSGMNYFIQRSTNLVAQPSFSTIQSNIVGQAGTTSYTDTNAVGAGPFFHRVGVQ